jgi:hypothetical protein
LLGSDGQGDAGRVLTSACRHQAADGVPAGAGGVPPRNGDRRPREGDVGAGQDVALLSCSEKETGGSDSDPAAEGGLL